MSRLEALFLLAQRNGTDPAATAWEALSADGLALSRDGTRLDGEEANLAELRARFDRFARLRLPTLRCLGVA
ncbi:hypothetical protein [Azospirillum formosense]|uniref:hypothetical protein n=1 Tax=Azospirillum formosense TaxID=861533 RepID=UPI00157A2A63|nr:hypothetical protein [Azospirillum formosense]